MNRNFLHLPLEQQLLLIRKAGDQFDISDMAIEKDFWVCWLLEKLFTLPIKMAFKGGTSLSKAFGLIKRFSEDVDITIDYRNFNPQLNLMHMNRTQLKKIGIQLKEQLKIYISKTVLPHFREQISKIPTEKIFEITLSDEGGALRFYYPSIINEQSNYLRDHVLIEFGVRNSTAPCEKYRISPYVAHIADNNVSLPTPLVDTLSPVRTFWEKATLIHVECHRDHFMKTPERLSRHWYDLFMLNQSWIGQKALSSQDIFKSVLEHKKAFFNASYTHYDDCVIGGFRLVPARSYQISLAKDFNHMVAAGMFYGDTPPTFDEIIKSLERLEAMINGNGWEIWGS